jgi:hypothetical protein
MQNHVSILTTNEIKDVIGGFVKGESQFKLTLDGFLEVFQVGAVMGVGFIFIRAAYCVIQKHCMGKQI